MYSLSRDEQSPLCVCLCGGVGSGECVSQGVGGVAH